MTFALGFDLGTTFTSAAVFADDRVEMMMFEEGAEIPSAVAVDDAGGLEFGTTARRRLLTTPERVATEFKRRFGSPDPVVLGGLALLPEDLQAQLLRSVLTAVERQRGDGAARGITVCHPATWGAYKRNLLLQAVGRVVDTPITLISEPEAAAVWYAQKQAVRPGGLLAVYDLGGGTFDVALVRRTAEGFEFAAEPDGDERLGGIDFDDIVLEHVERSLGDALDAIDFDDPAVRSMYANLRAECVTAKVALSSSTDVAIPVLLPGIVTQVRLTRVEFEERIRPLVEHSVELLVGILRAAGVSGPELDAVLLVGGSSRVPLITEVLRTALDAQIRVDAHPKHAIALGAAWYAGSTHLAAVPPVPLRRREVSDHAAKGAALRRERRFEEADEELGLALALDPDDPLSLGMRADVRRLLGRADEARADVDRALAIDPAHVLARTVRAALHRSAKRLSEALVDLGHALESQPESVWPLALRSDVLLQLGRLPEATESARLAVHHGPDHVFALGRRAELHRLAGESADALALFERAHRLEPANPWIGERLALLRGNGVSDAS